MGLTFIEAAVSSTSGKEEHVRFLVDSGAGYTVLPDEVWQKLGLKPERSMDFVLADGTTIIRNISECLIILRISDKETRKGHTPVVLGEPGDDPLLGIVTLENLGLILDPFQRILRPMKMRIA